MALTDPQSITVATVAKSMPRVSVKESSSTYSKDDETYKLTISHDRNTKTKRIRSSMRIDRREIVADPLTAVNDYENLAIYLVIDRPEVGFSATQVDDVVQAFKTWLSNANVTAVYGLQS